MFGSVYHKQLWSWDPVEGIRPKQHQKFDLPSYLKIIKFKRDQKKRLPKVQDTIGNVE
jgi:hypothetical protein